MKREAAIFHDCIDYLLVNIESVINTLQPACSPHQSTSIVAQNKFAEGSRFLRKAMPSSWWCMWCG